MILSFYDTGSCSEEEASDLTIQRLYTFRTGVTGYLYVTHANFLSIFSVLNWRSELVSDFRTRVRCLLRTC